MSRSIRHTPDISAALWAEIASTSMRAHFSTYGAPAIGNGGTAGNLRTNASTIGRVAGVEVTKASTDDLWDLSGETDTIAAQYRAYWLYVSAAGAGSFVAGPNAPTAAQALAALPAPAEDQCIVGVYVAGPTTDFDDAGGLAAQGDIYNGIAPGAALDGTGKTLYQAPARVDLINA